MTRDFGELRDLLFQMENEPGGTMQILSPLNGDPKPKQRALILCDAGLFRETNDNVFRMTNEGHNFLDLVRDDEVWDYLEEEHRALAGTGKIMTFDSIEQMAPSAISMVSSRKTGGGEPGKAETDYDPLEDFR